MRKRATNVDRRRKNYGPQSGGWAKSKKVRELRPVCSAIAAIAINESD